MDSPEGHEALPGKVWAVGTNLLEVALKVEPRDALMLDGVTEEGRHMVEMVGRDGTNRLREVWMKPPWADPRLMNVEDWAQDMVVNCTRQNMPGVDPQKLEIETKIERHYDESKARRPYNPDWDLDARAKLELVDTEGNAAQGYRAWLDKERGQPLALPKEWRLKEFYGTTNWVPETVYLEMDTNVIESAEGIQAATLRLTVSRGPVAGSGQQTAMAEGGEAEKVEEELDLFPVEMMVDANRDGHIRFEGKYKDPKTADKPVDTTKENKPFRFWLNNDQDVGTLWGVFGPEPEHYVPVEPDYADGEIAHARDLEDFARINVHFGGLWQEIRDGKFKIGLKWTKVREAAPALNLWPNMSDLGRDDYLTIPDVAQKHARLKNPVLVEGSTPAVIPQTHWSQVRLGKDQPEGYFLFEGVAEGKGKLRIVLLDKNDKELEVGPGVWVNLLDIKRMYQRAHALPRREDFPAPFEVHGVGRVPFPYQRAEDGSLTIPDANVDWAQGDGTMGPVAYSPAWDETDEAVVLVHGVGLDVNQHRIWAESAFKRMWWEGYKGGFYSFRWHGETPPVPPAQNLRFIFNLPEYRAWTWGGSLRKFVENHVKPGRVRVCLIAHSLGNVVAHSAIEQGLRVDAYAMLAAAISAGYLDRNAPEEPTLVRAEGRILQIMQVDSRWNETGLAPYSKRTPSRAGILESGLGRAGRLCNYFNRDDFWLTTSGPFEGLAPFHWVRNNEQTKPTDAHPLDEKLALGMGLMQWRYRCDNPELTGYWEDGWQFGTDPRSVDIDSDYERWAQPSGLLRPVSDEHENRAFLSRSRTLAAGSAAIPSGISGSQRDMHLDYGFTDDQREHSAYFNRPIQYLYCRLPTGSAGAYSGAVSGSGAYPQSLWEALLVDGGIQRSRSP